MPSKEPTPAESSGSVRQLPRVAPLTRWECSVLGINHDEGDDTGVVADSELPLTEADRDHEAWPFGAAAQVFLRASAFATALISAQQAHLVAKRCCMQCVAWTLALQAQAHRALSEELTEQVRRLNRPAAGIAVSEGEPW